MDFELTEEQKMLQDMAYRFAKANFTAVSQECDEQEKYTAEIRKKAAAAGARRRLDSGGVRRRRGGLRGERDHHRGALQGGHGDRPERHGGDLRLRGDLPVRDARSRRRPGFRPSAAASRSRAGAFTEPNAGTDVAGYKTRAVKDGSDYVINGNKMFITNGTVCDFMVTQCITNPEEKKHNSFSLIIVPADAKGVTRNKIHGKLGIRASDTAEIALEDVRVPQANLVGKEGNGFRELMHFFDTTRVMVAAQALGLSEACLETSVKYVKERTAFGQPLGAYQLTQMKLTEMAIRIEALRGLVYKAAWLIDQGRPDYTLAAMAKFFGGQTAVFCANYAVELHGGYGYVEEYPVSEVVPRRQDPRTLRGDEGGGDHDDRPHLQTR